MDVSFFQNSLPSRQGWFLLRFSHLRKMKNLLSITSIEFLIPKEIYLEPFLMSFILHLFFNLQLNNEPMPVYQLSEDLVFPHPSLAEEDGLLAIGGDLSPDRLILAYANGIFPWFNEGQPILWWSINPRLVLFPEKFKLSKSLKQSLANKEYEVSFDENFEKVIQQCAGVNRPNQDDTWINHEMIEAYTRLHNLGFVHSVETRLNGKLVGGLYGVSLGRIFYGESMFFTERDASKVALYHLVEKLKTWKFLAIDAQQDTEHMRSLGAETIPLEDFMELLNKSSKYETIRGNWGSI